MSLPARFLPIAFALVFVVSCRSKEGTVSTGDQYATISTNFTDTLSLHTSTVLVDDSVITSTRINLPNQPVSYNTSLLAGSFADAAAGDVTAQCFTQLRLATENANISTEVVDSAVLILDYRGYYYGDTTQSQTLEVFELTSALDPNSVYFSSSPAPSYNSTTIGTKTFAAKPFTRDATGKVLLRIPISTSWAQTIFSSGGTTSDNFVQQMKGIAIVPQSAGVGSVLRFNLSSVDTKLAIYYNNGTEYRLTISTGGMGFSRITSDRSSTAFSSLTSTYDAVSSSNTSEATYLQGGVGVKTKVEFPYLASFKAAVSPEVVINKALLFIPVVSGSTSNLRASPGLYFIRTDATNHLLYNASGGLAFIQKPNQPQNGSGFNVYAPYDSINKQYEVDVTDYVRDLLYGRFPSTAFYISPAFNGVTVERTFISSASPLLTNRMKLKLYYTQK